MESQRPEGLDKIRELESQQPWKRPEVAEPQTRQRPVFTQPLQNIDAIAEGQTAHFECRLIPVGDPTLKIEWFRNEKLVETSSFIVSYFFIINYQLSIKCIKKIFIFNYILHSRF